MNINYFKRGMKDGVPIGLGYFAVSFSLGIAAKSAGLNPFEALLASLLCNASAGEYALFTLIKVSAPYFQVALLTLITNIRYLLMSLALSQKVDPHLKLKHRLLLSYGVTDELFAIAINEEGYLNPFYSYGAYLVALSAWALGTALGCYMGSIMPVSLVSAFSVALYGMFLAVIVPKAKKDKIVLGLVIVSFVASYFSKYLNLSGGMATIVLTILIAGAGAFLFPKEADVNE